MCPGHSEGHEVSKRRRLGHPGWLVCMVIKQLDWAADMCRRFSVCVPLYAFTLQLNGCTMS